MQSKLVTNRQTRRNLFSLAVFLLVSMYAFAQNAVTGIVKDKTGEPRGFSFSEYVCICPKCGDRYCKG